MELLQKNKKVLIAIGAIVLLVVLYLVFFSGGGSVKKNYQTDPTARGLVSELSESPADAIVGRELLTMLLTLRSIKLDSAFFQNPVFGSLQDWSRPIDPQPLGRSLGRSNPFGDFGKASVSAPAATGAGSGKVPKEESTAEDFSF